MYFVQGPPLINDVTASTSRTPSDLSGFDIFIMWTVSGCITSMCESIALFYKTPINTHTYYYSLIM